MKTESTACCIVGGGPAGAVLALLLARRGVAVTLLETHLDFDREFRGDTLHASTMELMDEINLAERLLALRHAKVSQVSLPTREGALKLNVFGSLKSKFPYITIMAQAQFLEFITAEAAHYPNFRLVMGAHVDTLIETAGGVTGVRYHGPQGEQEVQAVITIGADGRFSTVRKLAGFQPIKAASPIDVLWFRIARRESDPQEVLSTRVGRGLFMIFIDRFDYWQVGCVIAKGGYAQLRATGLEALRTMFASVAPEWADRFGALQDWKQIAVLSVESSRLKRWHQPGLLLIGDAAHVMSPVGGVGINYAIQDAVVAANVLGPKLLARAPICQSDLATVQRQREWPTRVIQIFQSFAQQAVMAQVVSRKTNQFVVPRFVQAILRVPGLLALPARFIAYGFWPPRLMWF